MAGLCAVCGKAALATKYSCAVCAEKAAVHAREVRRKKRETFIAEHGGDGHALRSQKVPVETVRQCKKCNSYLPVEEFYWNDQSKGLRKHVCKKCDAARVDRWNKSNPEKRSVVYRTRHLKRTYGVTPEQYDAQLKLQNGACAICSRKEKDSRYQKLCVDHSHQTLQVRGLLCFGCNAAIGSFEDNPEVLEKAAAYLRQFKCTEIKM